MVSVDNIPDARLVGSLHLEGEEGLEPLLGEGVQHLHLTSLEGSREKDKIRL